MDSTTNRPASLEQLGLIHPGWPLPVASFNHFTTACSVGAAGHDLCGGTVLPHDVPCECGCHDTDAPLSRDTLAREAAPLTETADLELGERVIHHMIVQTWLGTPAALARLWEQQLAEAGAGHTLDEYAEAGQELTALSVCLCLWHAPGEFPAASACVPCCDCWVECDRAICRKFGTVHRIGGCVMVPADPPEPTPEEIWRRRFESAMRAIDYSRVDGNQPATDFDCAVVLAQWHRLPRPPARCEQRYCDCADDMWAAWILGPQCLFPGCQARYSSHLAALPADSAGATNTGWHLTVADTLAERAALRFADGTPTHDHTLTGPADHTCVQGPLCALQAHACAYDQFLDDPITVAYGVGSEMLHLVDCAGCDAMMDGGGCGHVSCDDVDGGAARVAGSSSYDCPACTQVTFGTV